MALTASSATGLSSVASAATAPAAAASARQCGMSTRMMSSCAAVFTASTLLDLQCNMWRVVRWVPATAEGGNNGDAGSRLHYDSVGIVLQLRS